MNFLEVLRTAVFALRGNWLRSALTSLGVIIGIAAVIVMVSVGQGTQSEIDKLVSGLGSNRLDISAGGGGRGTGGVRLSSSSFFTLTEDDAEAIRTEVPEVQYVAASLRGGTQAVYAENNWSTQWQGVQPDFFDINGWTIASGSNFEARDYGSGAKSVILGETVRRELFGDEDAIGQTIRLGRVPYTVLGTLNPKGQGGFGQDQDDVVLVPLETGRRRMLGAMGLPNGAVMQIAVGVGRAEDVSYAQEQIEGLLRQRHKIQPGGDDWQDVMLRCYEAYQERCERAGLVDFAELLISLIGGALGIAIGVVGTLLVSRIGALPVALNGQVIGLAAGFSIATGLFFGYYPARKASQLDPIEALRQQ